MNRFFSKLDLRDIKIDPESTRFPPDDDEERDEAAEVAVEANMETHDERAAVVEEPVAADIADDVIPASENGHGAERAGH